MKPGENAEIQWAPRVRPEKIRRLYEADALGMADEDLTNEVWYSLYARCETIGCVTERRCPHCGAELDGAWSSDERDRALKCLGCGWSSTWAVYHRSYKNRRIHGGRAYAAFLDFLKEAPAVKTPRDKMMAIDRLIHAVHSDLSGVWTTPGACNLIEGSLKQVVELLVGLAYGPMSTPGARLLHDQWLQKIVESEQTTRDFYARRDKDCRESVASYILPDGPRGRGGA